MNNNQVNIMYATFPEYIFLLIIRKGGQVNENNYFCQVKLIQLDCLRLG